MRHGSLFSGIGGIDLAFEMAGMETTWTCEIDDWANELLEKRFPKANHYRDIKEIGKNNLESVDIISGGFPCQDISTAKRGGDGLDGKRSGLWFEMWRVISELRPRWVLIENVANLTSKGGERVLHDLAKIGYDAEWQIISARDVGAKHLRKRIWIIAYPKNVSNRLREGFSRELHRISLKDRNTMGKEWSSEGNIQRYDNELSDTLCGELEGLNRKPKGESGNEARRGNNSESVIQRQSSKLSNAESGRHRRGSGEQRETEERKVQQEKQKRSKVGSKTKRCSTKLSKPKQRRAKQRIKGKDRGDGEFKIETFERLKNEPRLDRVAYGLSQKVDRYNDRVKGLGNSVVPQIPYQIGKRIMLINNIIGEQNE